MSSASMLSSWRHRVRKVVIRTTVATTVSLGILEYTTELPSKGRSSWLYHRLADHYVTPFLRTFLGPETAHALAIRTAEYGLCPIHRASTASEQYVNLEQRLFWSTSGGGDLKFSNPIGLAVGFDKDGTTVQPMLDLGFGFIEIGTVTPKPQPGNPSPRMFRLPEHKAIINRYGFNSTGAHQVLHNMQLFRQQQQQQQQQHSYPFLWQRFWRTIYPERHAVGPVGINIGKNKDTDNEHAVDDYVQCIQLLGPVADYLVLNISSPNTPGLRDIQTTTTKTFSLRQFLHTCIQARNNLPQQHKHNNNSNSNKPAPPLLLKLAPDLTDEQLDEIAQVCLDVGIDGIVISNTTNQRPLELLSSTVANEQGGLSGEPLRQRSTQVIRQLFRTTQGQIPIIGVGGIFTGQDAYEKLKAGACLVQIYSSMVYQGPGTVSRMRQELADILRSNGHKSLQDVIGRDHEEWFWQNQQQEHEKQNARLQSMEPVLKEL